MAEGDKTTDKTVMDLFDDKPDERGGVPIKKGARHANNKASPFLMAMFFGGFLIVVFMVYAVVTANWKPHPPKIDNAALMADLVRATPTLGVHFEATKLIDRPVSTEFSAPAASTPSIVVITATFVATELPPPTATSAPDLFLYVRFFYPKGGWKNAKTITGISPDTIDSFGAACPEFLSIGQRLSTALGEYTCLDRVTAYCDNRVCSIIVYSRAKNGQESYIPAYYAVARLPKDGQ